MLQKLFSVAQNKCLIEGADGIMMQELMLGGHLYLKVMKINSLNNRIIKSIFFSDSQRKVAIVVEFGQNQLA